MDSLYSDSEQRKKDIVSTAEVFRNQGYTKTVSDVLEYCKILDGTTVPLLGDFVKRLNSTFGILEKDFSESLPFGKDYRKRCFEDTKVIIINALKKSPSVFKQSLLIINPLLKRMNEAREMASSIAEGLVNITEKKMRFHLYCYTYLIIFEGLFDELIRMLYFLNNLSVGKTPIIFQKLEKMEVKEIYPLFKPVSLENWKEKKHIRNAIGHVTAHYDVIKNEIQFIDKFKNKYWTETLSFNEFIEKGAELDASVMAFMYVFLLLRISDLIMSKNPYAE